ncbi:MAG: hypothetical protein WC169_06725 [Dehalococcoidia bacterium]
MVDSKSLATSDGMSVLITDFLTRGGSARSAAFCISTPCLMPYLSAWNRMRWTCSTELADKPLPSLYSPA